MDVLCASADMMLNSEVRRTSMMRPTEDFDIMRSRSPEFGPNGKKITIHMRIRVYVRVRV